VPHVFLIFPGMLNDNYIVVSLG